MFRKVITSIIFGLIILSCASQSYANAPIGGQTQPGERYMSNEERFREEMKNPQLVLSDKMRIKDKLFPKRFQLFQTYYNIDLGMYYYKQEYDYYCGPATVYQMLKYFNGTSPSQQDIARALGTTSAGTVGTEIPKYLNKKQNFRTYDIYTVSTLSGMKVVINDALDANAPVVLRIKLPSTNNEFGYYTPGHFLNVGGQNTGAINYKIVDPFYGYSGGPQSSTYNVSAQGVLQAVKNHSQQHLYY